MLTYTDCYDSMSLCCVKTHHCTIFDHDACCAGNGLGEEPSVACARGIRRHVDLASALIRGTCSRMLATVPLSFSSLAPGPTPRPWPPGPDPKVLGPHSQSPQVPEGLRGAGCETSPLNLSLPANVHANRPHGARAVRSSRDPLNPSLRNEDSHLR